MDAQPGPSRETRDQSPKSDFLSPRKKRPRGSFSVQEKALIVNVYKYNIDNWPQSTEWSSKECAKKTSDMTGVALSSVYKITKEYKTTKDFEKPKKTGPQLNFKDKIDEFTFAAIRRKVHEFYFRNEAPTIEKIHQVIAADSTMPVMSKTILRKVLKHLNFKYISRKRRSALTDNREIILWRQRYLNQIKQYRREGKFIYYQDETWVNEGHTVSKVWCDTSIESSRQAFLEGLSPGLKTPTGKGRRLIVSHIGSEEGFLEDGLLVFESKKGMADYHQEMNGEVFEEWFASVLPKLKPNSVVVLDNAPYHSRKVERVPTTAWKKIDIQAWLSSKNLNFGDNMLKANLLEIVRHEKHKYQQYVVDEMAAVHGITVLRLPPYHCELNPIEMVWAQAKGHVAKNNKTFKMAEVKQLLLEGLGNVSPAKWRECVQHVIKEEDKMCLLDNLMDNVCDSFIIRIDDNDSDEESDLSDNISFNE